MSTVRILPLGVPLAVGFSLAGYTAMVLFSLLALLVTMLVMRAVRGPVRSRSAEESRR